MGTVTGSPPPSGQPAQPPYEPVEQNQDEDAGVAGSVSSGWVEVYPPDGGLPLDDPIGPEPASSGGTVATGLFGITVLLIAAGSTTTLFRLAFDYGPSHTNLSNDLTTSAWQFSVSDQEPGATLSTHTGLTPLLVGIPLALCALLLVAVIVLRLRANRPSTSSTRAARAAGVLGVVAASFLAGLVFALGMFELAWTTFGQSGEIDALTTTIGAGFWVLVVAAVVGVAAGVLGFRNRVDRVEFVPAEPAIPVHGDEFGQFGPRVAEPPLEWPVVAVIPDTAGPYPGPGTSKQAGASEE
jgi:hypothetical protein